MKGPPAPVLLIAAFILYCPWDAAQETSSTYATDEGVHCNKCPAGQKVLEDCTKSITDPTCEPCDDHHFSRELNGKKHCTMCRRPCPRNGYEYQNCSRTTDRHCLCQPGYHRYPIDPIDPDFECRKHTVCAVDEGYVFEGNHTHDASCRKCSVDEFVNRTNPKYPRCQLKRQDNYTESTTSIPSTTLVTTTEGSSSLSGGEVAGIVIGILVVLIIIIIIILGIVYWRRRTRQTSGNETSDRNTVESQAMINQSGASAENHLQGDAHDQPASPSNGHGHQPEEASPTYNWSRDFIKRTAFHDLAHGLGADWESFIYKLPFIPVTRIQTIIEKKREENPTVPKRIRSCLTEWLRKCPDSVTGENIAKALTDCRHGELLEELQRKHLASSP